MEDNDTGAEKRGNLKLFAKADAENLCIFNLFSVFRQMNLQQLFR